MGLEVNPPPTPPGFFFRGSFEPLRLPQFPAPFAKHCRGPGGADRNLRQPPPPPPGWVPLGGADRDLYLPPPPPHLSSPRAYSSISRSLVRSPSRRRGHGLLGRIMWLLEAFQEEGGNTPITTPDKKRKLQSIPLNFHFLLLGFFRILLGLFCQKTHGKFFRSVSNPFRVFLRIFGDVGETFWVTHLIGPFVRSHHLGVVS